MMMLSVLFVFLQLCSLQMTVVSKPVCQLQGDLIETAYNHLKDQGGRFPSHCLSYNDIISFPSSALSVPKTSRPSRSLQCSRALSLINETLFGAQQLFEEPGITIGEGGVNWNRSEFDRFQGVWHRLLRETDSMPSACFSGSGVLTPYFSNVTAVVQQQESAACGWMALRRDLLRFLNSILLRSRACFTWRSPKLL